MHAECFSEESRAARNHAEGIVSLYNQELTDKKRLHLMKRMINLEERIGDEQSAQEWRTKVENEKTKMPSGAQVKED